MNAGKRAIAKEEKRMEKERKRRIELANKMLIPVGKKTKESLGIEAIDPEGVFRMAGKPAILHLLRRERCMKRCGRKS